MGDVLQYKANYSVKVTKAAIRQGKKLPITEKQKLEIINDLKLLKFWSENESNYDYQSAYGAIEFKYDLAGNKWIRVMVYQDDARKIMWIIKVFAKKSNQISRVDQIGIETAVSRIRAEIRAFEKKQKYERAKKKLNLVSGGSGNE